MYYIIGTNQKIFNTLFYFCQLINFKKKNSLIKKYFPYYIRNIRLAFPIVISQLGQIVVQQADIMMVGRVGTAELAAIGFANAVFIFGLILIIGFSSGLTPAVGHINEKKNYPELAKLLSNSFFINLIISILIIILLIVSSFFFKNMGQEQEVVELSKPYFYAITLSILPLSIFYTQKQFAEGIGNTKNAMYITISANIINIVLNYILIFGKMGFPAYGILGAGIATLISRIYMAVVFLIIFKINPLFKSTFERLKTTLIHKIEIKKLFHLGFPISMQMLLEVTAFAFSNIMAGWLGVISLAAHQVAAVLSSMSFMLVLGVGSATTIRVAHQFAAKNKKGLMMAANASIHIVLVFMCIMAVLFYAFRNYFPLLYTDDYQVIKLSATLLVAVAFYQIFDGLQVVMVSILRGLGDVKHAMIYSFIAYILINIPIGYLLAFSLKLGTVGLWIGFIFGLGVAAILFYTRIVKIYKNNKIQ